MLAKEIFEELGYKQIDCCEDYIVYEKVIIVASKMDKYFIEIDFKNKMFSKYKNQKDMHLGDVFINFKELKAINQQISELGWEE